MKPTVVGKKDKLSVHMDKKDVHAAWKAIKRILNEDAQEPFLQQGDRGLIMEAMTKLAEQHRPNAGDPYEVKLTVEQAKGTWHCINICLTNDLFEEMQAKLALNRAMTLLALEIDAYDEVSPKPALSIVP